MTGFVATQIQKPANEQDFERQVGAVFRVLLNDPNVRRAGKRGQKQKGVDLVGNRDGHPKKVVGVQCKLKGPNKQLTAKEVRNEVREALKFKPRLNEYIIVTTAENDIKLDELALTLQAEQEAKGRRISIVVWGWGTLEDRIHEHDGLPEVFDPGFSPGLKQLRDKVDTVLANQITSAGQSAEIVARLDRASESQQTKLPRTFASRELEASLNRVCKRRGFGEADWPVEISALADKAMEGEFSLASNGLRADVVGRAARANATPNHKDAAQRYRRFVQALGEGQEDPVFDALCLEAVGESNKAIQTLRSVNVPDALTTAFMILGRTKGFEAAFAWFQSEALSIRNLNPIGAQNYLIKQVDRGNVDQALREITTLPASYFNDAPCLHVCKGNLILASILPPDQKAAIFSGLGLNPRALQLASDIPSRSKIKDARREFAQVALQAKELELKFLPEVLEELDLWLQLEDADTADAARTQLREDLSDPAQTLKWVRLALAYEIPFNKEALQRQLSGRLHAGGWSAEEAFAALLLAYHGGSAAGLAAFFDESRAELLRQEQLNTHVLLGLEVEALGHARRIEDAKARLSEVESRLTNEEVAQLRRSIEGVEARDSAERLRKEYENSGSLTALRLLVLSAAQTQDHRMLAQFAPTLVRATRQVGDFRLAVGGLYNEREYQRVIELCEEIPQLYSLDIEFKSLRAWSHFQLGAIVQARALARELFDERGERNDRELAINTAIEAGDWGYLQALVTKELKNLECLDAPTLMRMSRVALEVGSPYVDQFRDAAIRRFPDNPNVFLGAYTLAVERGNEDTDKNAHLWFQKAVALSDKEGPVQSLSFKEVIEQSKGWNERVENISQLITENRIPLFMAAKALRRQPAEMLVGQALRNREVVDPRAQTAILSFAGNRQRVDLTCIREAAFDQTAIFTLDYLGLLDRAMGFFDRVVIAPTTLSSLFVQRQFLRVRQPSQAKKAHRIIDLIATKKLQVLPLLAAFPSELQREVGDDLAALLGAAVASDAIVVRSAPVHKLGSLLEEDADLSAFEAILADTHSVLKYLVESGKIEAPVKDNAAAYLGQVDKGRANGRQLSAESKVYLDSLTVNYLDHVDLLGPLAASIAAVYVPSAVEAEARGIINYSEFSGEIVSAVERIKETLNAALESGRLVFTKHRLRDDVGADDAEELNQFTTFDLLTDLSAFHAVIVDDRFLNKDQSWTHGGKVVPTATTVDLLNSMRAGHRLSDSEYWLAMHKLRQAGYCYVPLEPEELVHHVMRPPVRGDALVETPELRAIRENISIPRRADVFRTGDEPWLAAVRFAFVQALRTLWSRDPAADGLEARSDWLFHSLPKPFAWCVDPSDPNRWALATQQTVVQYGLFAFSFGGDRTQRMRYAKWIDERLFRPIEVSYPWLMRPIIEFAKQHVEQLVEADDSDEAEV